MKLNLIRLVLNLQVIFRGYIMGYQRKNLIHSRSGLNLSRRRFLQNSFFGVAGLLTAGTLPMRLTAHAASNAQPIQLDALSISKVAYIARPEHQVAASAVVILHDWWGLNGEVKRLADQCAAQGFIGIAPDLFGGRVANSLGEAEKILASLNTDDILNQIRSVLNYTARYEKVASQTITLIAANFGSRLAIALSRQTLDVGSIVILQGQSSISDQALNGFTRMQAEQHLIDAHIMSSPINDSQLLPFALLGRPRQMAPMLVSNRSFGYMAENTSHKQFNREWSRMMGWIQRDS